MLMHEPWTMVAKQSINDHKKFSYIVTLYCMYSCKTTTTLNENILQRVIFALLCFAPICIVYTNIVDSTPK